MIFVYSDYLEAGVASLPGAERDLERVSNAFKKAGFIVNTAINPKLDTLNSLLQEFSQKSANAEIAVMYTTGHGFEHNKIVYLRPNNYPFNDGPENLSELAINVSKLSEYMNAQKSNLLFFGGCRTHMRPTSASSGRAKGVRR